MTVALGLGLQAASWQVSAGRPRIGACCAAQPQLQSDFFAAIAHLTALQELSVGNWMPDREGAGKADDVCLAPLRALTQLSAMRLSMLHGAAAMSLPPLPALRVRAIGSEAFSSLCHGACGSIKVACRLCANSTALLTTLGDGSASCPPFVLHHHTNVPRNTLQ